MKYLIYPILILLCCSCAEKQVEDTMDDSLEFALPEWAKNATIYEANVRQMTEEGNFKGLEEHLPRIKEMGIDIVWLMPVHPISEVRRKATGDKFTSEIEDPEERKKYLGSAYSVADYGAVNPDYGTMDDFKSMLAKAHSLDMKLIIDWVPNHTGWDHVWITEHPEWYTQDSLGNIIDPIDYNTGKSWGWTDVADLNYDNQDMRDEMIKELKYWINDVGIDGFRMDVAHGVPQDFWDRVAIELMKEKEDIFLLAESARPDNLNNMSFHVDYGWSLHHLMNEIAKGEKKAKDIDAWMVQDDSIYTEGFHMNFTSNHDENSWNGTVFERMEDSHMTFAVFSVCFEGMPLLYSGMEEPMKKRLAFFTKDNIGFNEYAYAEFYKTLFDLKHRNKALWNGDYGADVVKLFDHDDIYAFERNNDGDIVICVLNLSGEAQEFTVPKTVTMTDVFMGDEITWTEGETISLDAWQYIVLSNR